jgi:hypothetical protein
MKGPPGPGEGAGWLRVGIVPEPEFPLKEDDAEGVGCTPFAGVPLADAAGEKSSVGSKYGLFPPFWCCMLPVEGVGS